MTLTISLILALAIKLKGLKLDAPFLAYFFLYPFLIYGESQLLGNPFFSFPEFWILGALSFVIGLTSSVDIYLGETKEIPHGVESMVFLGLCSLFKSEAFLASSLVMSFVWSYKIYVRRNGHTQNDGILNLLLLFTLVRLGGYDLQLLGMTWLGYSVLVLAFALNLSALSYIRFLSAWGVFLFGIGFLGFETAEIIIVSILLGLVTVVSRCLSLQTLLADKMSSNGWYKRILVLIFERNNPRLLTPNLKREPVKQPSSNRRFLKYEDSENIFLEQCLFALVLVAVLGTGMFLV